MGAEFIILTEGRLIDHCELITSMWFLTSKSNFVQGNSKPMDPLVIAISASTKNRLRFDCGLEASLRHSVASQRTS
jgi:hypothetical protein